MTTKTDLFYPESYFSESLTFGTWVPIFCADVLHLKPFQEIYGREAEPRYAIRYSNGPFLFGNHPLNYVIVSGIVVRAEIRNLEKYRGQAVMLLYSEYIFFSMTEMYVKSNV